MTDAQANPQDAASDSASDDAMKAKRKKFLGFFALILILAAILYGIWALIILSVPIMLMWELKQRKLPQW